MTEANNLLDYEVFEEVEDKGQETIGRRWVLTQKEKHDIQMTKFKVKLVHFSLLLLWSLFWETSVL